MASARRATTVLLLRESQAGPEVFMVQRHRRSGFLPNAWVFPGGRVDDADALGAHPRVQGGGALASAFGAQPHDAVAYAIAGVRETFEESGVWLGAGQLPGALRDPMNRGEISLADALERHGASVDLDALTAWSWWVTPEAEPRRYDTWFLAAVVPEVAARHDAVEVVDSRWVSPRQILQDPDHQGFPLAPPTWWTLRELAAHDTAEQAIAAIRPADRPIQPIMQFVEAGIQLLLPGHPDHPEPSIDGLADRITFDTDASRGWVAWRGPQRLPSLP